jgi:hypothetical protein
MVNAATTAKWGQGVSPGVMATREAAVERVGLSARFGPRRSFT